MASLVLVLETATTHSSVALLRGGAVVAHAPVVSRDPVTGGRVEGLMPAISHCFITAHATPAELSSVMCGAGPGSFTSLRSVSAIAKGLCSVLGIPLYAVPTMELLVATARLPDGCYVTALDAGRGEYYTSDVSIADGDMTTVTPVTLLDWHTLTAQARARNATVVGPNATIDVAPDARAVLSLVPRITAVGPVDLDLWEPWYGRLAEAQVQWEAAHGRPLSL